MDYKKRIRDYYSKLVQTIDALNIDEINLAMNAIDDVYNWGGNIYICGNGGSAATASHYTNDFNKGISEYVDKKYKFLCLNDNIATIMAIANDISYEDVFSFQLDGRITKDDLLVAISGSGNSKNIIKAVEKAHERGATVIGISGYDGGKLKKISDYSMHVNVDNMQVVEDVHMTFDHMMFKVFLESKLNNK